MASQLVCQHEGSDSCEMTAFIPRCSHRGAAWPTFSRADCECLQAKKPKDYQVFIISWSPVSFNLNLSTQAVCNMLFNREIPLFNFKRKKHRTSASNTGRCGGEPRGFAHNAKRRTNECNRDYQAFCMPRFLTTVQ